MAYTFSPPLPLERLFSPFLRTAMAMTFVGASLAMRKHEHFAIEFFVEKLPERRARGVKRFSLALVVVFSVILIWFGTVQVIQGWNTVTPVLEIPRWVPYAAVPFGGLLMLLGSLQELFARTPELSEGEAVER